MVVANISLNACYLKTLYYFKLEVFTLNDQNKNVFKAWSVITTLKKTIFQTVEYYIQIFSTLT